MVAEAGDPRLQARNEGESMRVAHPDWANYLQQIGKEVSELGVCEFGDAAPRALLSLPTGRFSYWLLASGALQASLSPLGAVPPGSRVATWNSNLARMSDVPFEPQTATSWKIGTTTVNPKTWPTVALPETTPENRGASKPSKDYRQQLSKLQGHQHDWYVWYARHCLRPVIIVGTGREHIQRQRQTLLDEARDWFPHDVAALIDEDTNLTSSPDRTLFHPFMVFDAGVGHPRSWLRALKPRLVIVTSWSSYQRMSPSLFSRSPMIVVANRRVRSAAEAVLELPGLPHDSKLEGLLRRNLPGGVQAFGFSTVAQGEAGGDDDDFDEEELI